MPRFIVTLVAEGEFEIVEAGSAAVGPAGELNFQDLLTDFELPEGMPHSNSIQFFTQTVRTFAPGVWRDVRRSKDETA